MKGHVPTPPTVAKAMVAKLFAARAPRKGDALLDPGCGDGVFLHAVLTHCEEHGLPVPRLLGVELHPELAAKARKTLGRRAEILCQDFLVGDLPQAAFVVGNPPYVSLPALTRTERDRYRTNFRSAVGRFDLYALFIERGLSLLEPEGVLVFITPEKYQYVGAARPLRKLMVERGVRELDFQDEDIFPGRITYPVITTVAAGRGEARVVDRNGTRKTVELPSDGSSWNGVINGARRSPRSYVPLASLCDRISPGVATGCEEIFVVKRNSVEQKLLRHAHPTISGRQLLHGVQSDEVMLCPYDQDGVLLEEGKIPHLIQYLGVRRKRLEQRTCVQGGRQWYQYHDTFPGRAMLRPKILCKDIAAEPRFWLDEVGDFVPRHSVYYLVPKKDVAVKALYEYLNSAPAKEWLAAHCQRAAKGYYRLQSTVLQQLPVPATLLTGR